MNDSAKSRENASSTVNKPAKCPSLDFTKLFTVDELKWVEVASRGFSLDFTKLFLVEESGLVGGVGVSFSLDISKTVVLGIRGLPVRPKLVDTIYIDVTDIDLVG